jgi:hypothetical protein
MRRSCLDELSTNRVLNRLSAESVRPEPFDKLRTGYAERSRRANASNATDLIDNAIG